jgi:hypothetical protein
MITNRHKRIVGFIVIALLCIVLIPTKAFSQFDNSLYNMKVVPQTNLYNPAFVPDYKYHFGFPMLSSENVGFGSSGVKYQDVFYKRPDDSLAIDVDGLINALHDNNTFHFQDVTQILNFGIKFKKVYISASVSEIVDIDFNYSKQFMEFLAYGNANMIGETIDMSKMSLKAQHYREYALGIAYTVNKNLDIGGRVKLLYGKAAIDTKQMDGSFTTINEDYHLALKSNLIINTSLPDMGSDSTDRVKTLDYLMYSGNVGAAIDLGVNYKMDKWSFSGSVLDLGYINYDRYLTNYTSDNVDFTYKGVDAVELQNLNGDERNKRIEEIRDSIIDIFKLDKSADAFNVRLNAKVYLAANYQLNKGSSIGVLARADFYRNSIHPSFTLSLNQDLTKNVSAVASYSIADNSYLNIGFGLAVRVSVLQFYIVSDNIFGAFRPELVQYANLHFGVNFVFPENKKEKKMIDLEEEE